MLVGNTSSVCYWWAGIQ